MKLALVHDWLNQIGGAEDVLEVLVSMYPDAPIFTSIYGPDIMPERYQAWDIHPLWMNRLPAVHQRHQAYLAIYPFAWQGLDLSDYDVILSNKSGFCHGFKKGAESVHVCYCLAPTRYVWQLDHYIQREGMGKVVGGVLKPLIAYLKGWDYRAAQKVDHFIAISTEIQQRIKTYYDRDSDIIYPPVDTSRFRPVTAEAVEDYFLIISRLVPYKQIDLAVQAATRLGLPLKIGGQGRDIDRLKGMAGETVEFLGYVPDEALGPLMAKAKAFIFPGLEDFGITPVQAQAAGRPVIAYQGGGALDTVIEGETGVFFAEMTVDHLSEALAHFDASRYEQAVIRKNALRFDQKIFEAQIEAYLRQAWEAKQTGQGFVWRDPIQV